MLDLPRSMREFFLEVLLFLAIVQPLTLGGRKREWFFIIPIFM